MTSALTEDKTNANVTITDGTYSKTVTLTQKDSGWTTNVDDVKIGDVALKDTTPKKEGTATVSYDGTTAKVEFSK